MTLLFEALSGILRRDTVLLLARTDRLPELVDACVRGEVRLSDASKEALAADLHRASLEPLDDPDETAIVRLRLHGFRVEDAREALRERKGSADDAELRAVAFRGLPSWLGWHAEMSGSEPLMEGRLAALLLDCAKEGTLDEHEEGLVQVAEALARLLTSLNSDIDRDEAHGSAER